MILSGGVVHGACRGAAQFVRGGADRVVDLLRVGCEFVWMVECEWVEVRWKFEGGWFVL